MIVCCDIHRTVRLPFESIFRLLLNLKITLYLDNFIAYRYNKFYNNYSLQPSILLKNQGFKPIQKIM